MKKTLLIALSLLLVGFAVNVGATELKITDTSYVGSVVAGLPSSNFDVFLDNLLSLDAPSDPTLIDGNWYTRSENDFTATPPAGIKTDSSVAPTFTNFTGYVMGKYDAGNAGSFFWYIDGGTWTLPT